MVLFIVGAAFAQEVPNGDFDDGLTEWTGTARHLIGTTPSSAGYAAVRGDAAKGTLTSSGFVVTHEGLDWFARGAPYEIRVASTDGVQEEVETDDAVISSWVGRFMGVEDLCGMNVVIELEMLDALDSVDVDAFVLSGDPCAVYQDADEDGACPFGTDLDGDALCVTGAEISSEMEDCDDETPTVGPDAVEQPANGIDEDCDGLELCYVDTDGDNVGSSDVVPSESLGCFGEGIAAVDGERCEGFDDRLDADGDGTPDGCDTAEDPPPSALLPPEDVIGRFRGGACACSGGSGGPLWGLAWLGMGLAWRRRR